VLDSVIPQTIYRCICFRNHNQFPLLEQDRSIEKDCREKRALSLLMSKEDGALVIHQAFRAIGRMLLNRRVGPRLLNRRMLIPSCAKEAEMLKRASALLAVSLLVTLGFAKDKKNTLPPYVLSAKTVAVIIDPNAGISIDDPRANQDAQKDVEAALVNWGRFEPVLSRQTADLIIVLRKGNGPTMNETIPDPRRTPTNNGVPMGGQNGPQPGMSGQPGLGSGQQPPSPQTEIGQAVDSFVVYKGGDERPLDTPPAWRYVGADGLSPHSVPAVAAFRKAVENAEKAAAAKKP
jgi:hypothetical protein